jgi:DNA polymerase III delta prime subunit
VSTETRKTAPTIATVSPRQTRPRMVVVNFRVPEDVKTRAIERAEREGINLTDALRDFLTEWADVDEQG